MYTGFIAFGGGVRAGGHLEEIREVDIAPLITRLVLPFTGSDGKLVAGIMD